MTVVVTGGAGFIGSHLVKKLIDLGESVIVVDDLSTGRRENLDYLGVRSVEFLEADLTNFRDAKKALEGTDTVYHMAARVGGISYLHGNENIELASLETNVAIDANVFRACRESGVKQIIYPSSVSVYPMKKQERLGAIFSENEFSPQKKSILKSRFRDRFLFSLDPDGGYGLAKALGEIELHLMRGVGIGIARIFSAYGENEPLGESSHVLARLIKSAIRYPEERFDKLTAGQMVIWGDGTQTRDYVYVGDCAEAFVRLRDVTAKNNDSPVVVNIGAGIPVSMKELAKKVIEISGKEIRPVYEKDKPVGPVSRTADISRAKQLLGWEPKVSLEEGLRRTYQWIEQKIQ